MEPKGYGKGQTSASPRPLRLLRTRSPKAFLRRGALPPLPKGSEARRIRPPFPRTKPGRRLPLLPQDSASSKIPFQLCVWIQVSRKRKILQREMKRSASPRLGILKGHVTASCSNSCSGTKTAGRPARPRPPSGQRQPGLRPSPTYTPDEGGLTGPGKRWLADTGNSLFSRDRVS